MAEAVPQRKWDAYYQATSTRKPRRLLLDALARFGEFKGFAIDLGCGAGVDAAEMLRQGWQVLAIDQQPEALELLRQRVPGNLHNRLTLQAGSFDEIELPPADLIWAGFSLPFCPPERFEKLWFEIIHALEPGGRFAGDLFGERCYWLQQASMTSHTQEQALALLTPLEIELFEVEDGERQVAAQGIKWVHAFAVIARKKE